MNLTLRRKLYESIITSEKNYKRVISEIQLNENGDGYIKYNPEGVFVDPSAIGFTGTTTEIGDEELVRAELLVRLVSKYKYQASPKIIEIERVYKSVGRPGKGGRVDVIVRERNTNNAFLFIECKAPDKFDSDYNLIDGQLFRLSKQEQERPFYLAYYTSDIRMDSIAERLILIDPKKYLDFEMWNNAGQPSADVFPINYGIAEKRRFAKVERETLTRAPLNREATPELFNRIRNEIHDVIWGGGGTNNNEVFVYIAKLILCKIYDEKETIPNHDYEFQRLGDNQNLEDPVSLTNRLNDLYTRAEQAYLALNQSSKGPAFDVQRISPNKIVYVVSRLEPISITENVHEGDLLGEFFEQIVSQDFTQTKGQFFTPIKIVRFMLYLHNSINHCKKILSNQRDQLGRPRLPYVIDPSCGSGTFLIEYMKYIRKEIGTEEFKKEQPDRIQELHSSWFSGCSGNIWAKDFLFGIENNYDLGLACKVNMVLHGDGSMNTWIKSGILLFNNYWIDGRHNILGTIQEENVGHPYSNQRNEQFDLILSNPPFSIKMSPDEKKEVEKAFGGELKLSETLFIERWYQLLREGGFFCCILPEAILDTSTNESTRVFLIKHFRIHAIISLPYDAFKPFTSTKTCIVYAEKRSKDTIKRINEEMQSERKNSIQLTLENLLGSVFKKIGLANENIFMAEPSKIGYKRRKNLSDLVIENFLYSEDENGYLLSHIQADTVLSRYREKDYCEPDQELGFNVILENVFKRKGIRLDPKYRWLWDYQEGVVIGNKQKAEMLSKYLTICGLEKIKKGDLDQERQLIDLECVLARQGTIVEDIPEVEIVGSDKVSFKGAELLFSKLEPYLGKVIINPPQAAIGSTEWVGLRCKKGNDPLLLGYTLMLPEMCEAYRRLQSGKRHARLDPKELLELKIDINLNQEKKDKITKYREDIDNTKKKIIDLRSEVDNIIKE